MSPAAKSEEKQMFLQATFKVNIRWISGGDLGVWKAFSTLLLLVFKKRSPLFIIPGDGSFLIFTSSNLVSVPKDI